MKKAIVYGMLLTAVFIASCKKETSIENGNSAGGNFVAQINGVHWAATYNTEQAALARDTILISGISSDGQEISMTITDTVAGTYTLNQQSTSLAAYASTDSSGLYALTTNQSADASLAGGTVTITQIDKVNKTLSGVFTFKAYRTLDGQQRTITAGQFNQLPYTDTLPVIIPKDTLAATINGTSWTGQNITASAISGELTISGYSGDGTQSIGLILPSYSVPATYPMTITGAIPTYIGVYDVVSNGSNNEVPASSGSITILENNTTTSWLRGTFAFSTAAAPPQSGNAITDGFFSVYYGQ